MHATHLVGPLFLLLDPVLVDGHVLVFLGGGLGYFCGALLEGLGLVAADLECGWQKGRN